MPPFMALGMLVLVAAAVGATCPVREAALVSEVDSIARGPASTAVDPVAEAWARYGVEIVTGGQTWDEASLGAVLEALAALPPEVAGRLGNPSFGPLRILSNPEGRTLSGARPYANGANYYYNNDGRNEIVLMPSQGPLTVLHEMGHAYQLRGAPAGRYSWPYLGAEMRGFMAATGWHLLSSDADVSASPDGSDLRFRYDGPPVWQFLSRQDPAEDFANSFAYYFYFPTRLAESSPARYDWFDLHVGPAAP